MRPDALPLTAMSKKTLGLAILTGRTGAEERSGERVKAVAGQEKGAHCGLSLYNTPVGRKAQPITGATALN